MVMRAQRPLGLTAGPFFNMNANTAVSVNIEENHPIYSSKPFCFADRQGSLHLFNLYDE